MKSEKSVQISLPEVIDNIKNSMLGLSDTIACHNCDKNYCCIDQISIQISTIEFEQIKPHITNEQYKRAKFEIENPRLEYGKSVYSCPFNSPVTGKCEIYENRFVVCAGHGTVADTPEACNTKVSQTGTLIVNPMMTFSAASKDEHTRLYLGHIADGEPIDVLDAFRKVV